jgi:hypothetical protein
MAPQVLVAVGYVWSGPSGPRFRHFQAGICLGVHAAHRTGALRVPGTILNWYTDWDDRETARGCRVLLFKKKFLAAIRGGQKTQTIRLWQYRRMRAGQRSYIPGAGYVRIVAIEEIALAELTDADAWPDGFETAEQLRAEIAQLYPQQLAAGYRAFRVVFRLIDKDEYELA